MVLCPLYDPLPPLRPSATSTALCPLNCLLSPLQLLPSLRPPVPSEALCPFYGPQQTKRNNLSCFAKCFAKSRFVKTLRVVAKDLFRSSNDRDDRDNHDNHSSEMLSDNCEIAIIALAKKLAIIMIITSNKK